MTTDTALVDTGPAAPRWTDRAEKAAAAARLWLRSAGKAVDSYDVTCLIALAGMLTGMTIWFGLGPALTIVSSLLLVFGVAGARSAELEAREQREIDRRTRGV